MRLVQMPPELLHADDADLAGLGVDPRLLAAYRPYRARALTDRRGAAILAPVEAGTRAVLMVLARQIGAALRDENIQVRDRGGDLRSARKKLCYLPGQVLAAALEDPSARRALADEAACFLQDLDAAWPDASWPDASGSAVSVPVVFELLDARLAAGRPTILSADPARLPDEVRRGLRRRLTVLEVAKA